MVNPTTPSDQADDFESPDIHDVSGPPSGDAGAGGILREPAADESIARFEPIADSASSSSILASSSGVDLPLGSTPADVGANADASAAEKGVFQANSGENSETRLVISAPSNSSTTLATSTPMPVEPGPSNKTIPESEMGDSGFHPGMPPGWPAPTGTLFEENAGFSSEVTSSIPAAQKAMAVERSGQTVPQGPASNLLTLFLMSWASLATISAGWLWYNRVEPIGALENLVDDGDLRPGVVDPLARLSSRQTFSLGQTRTLGNIEITPTRIEKTRLKIEGVDGKTDPALVLTLRLKNVSKDQTFAPTDPVFFHFPDPPKKLKGMRVFDETGYTYTYAHAVGDQQTLILPFNLLYHQGFRFEGIEHKRLAPGEEFTAQVVLAEKFEEKLADKMIWRVKLRKGVNRSGKGVATVIGVRFRRDEIQATADIGG